MPVVSNTSPILNLAIIDKLFLLRKQFGEILIPSGVLDELRIEEELPGSRQIREAIRSGWIKVQRVNNRSVIQILQRELDKGEAEAIALASEIQAELTLLDEKEARKFAKSLGLKITGLLGIILHAWKNGELLSVSETIKELCDNAGFRISPKLLKSILHQCEAKNSSV
jgi:uncharacterized protein